MIINHRYKFIFLKTTRVAGTSVEAALSNICEPGDIWTSSASEHHRYRSGSGYKIPMDLREPYWWFRRLCWNVRPIRHKIMLRLAEYSGTDYWAHINARHLRATLPAEIWNSYYKVSIERNPWDRMVSHYYYRYPDERRRPPFEATVRKTHRSKNFAIYSIDGEIAVDKLMKYETLASDLRAFLDRVGAPSDLSIPFTNASVRGDGRNYRSLYDDETKEIVRRVHQREIEYCGYTF